MNEELRTIVTRWRFSCHDVAIETGRYTGIVRHERLCSLCDVIEDETRAIVEYKAFTEIREQFKDLLTTNPTIHQILNPKDCNTSW